MSSNPAAKLTDEQYLAIERAAEFRSEFVNGEMFAMSGGTLRHALLQSNVFGELYGQLRGRGCTAFTSDMRTKLGRALRKACSIAERSCPVILPRLWPSSGI